MKKILAVILAVVMIFSLTAVTAFAKKPHSKKYYKDAVKVGVAAGVVAGVVTYLIIDDIIDCIEDKYCDSDDYVPAKYPYYLRYPVIIGGKVEGYYIRYDSNGGSAVDSQYYMHGEYSVEPEEPVRTGYKFDGWYRDENCKIKPYDFDTLVTYGFTLYAKWIPA